MLDNEKVSHSTLAHWDSVIEILRLELRLSESLLRDSAADSDSSAADIWRVLRKHILHKREISTKPQNRGNQLPYNYWLRNETNTEHPCTYWAVKLKELDEWRTGFCKRLCQWRSVTHSHRLHWTSHALRWPPQKCPGWDARAGNRSILAKSKCVPNSRSLALSYLVIRRCWWMSCSSLLSSAQLSSAQLQASLLPTYSNDELGNVRAVQNEVVQCKVE